MDRVPPAQGHQRQTKGQNRNSLRQRSPGHPTAAARAAYHARWLRQFIQLSQKPDFTTKPDLPPPRAGGRARAGLVAWPRCAAPSSAWAAGARAPRSWARGCATPGSREAPVLRALTPSDRGSQVSGRPKPTHSTVLPCDRTTPHRVGTPGCPWGPGHPPSGTVPAHTASSCSISLKMYLLLLERHIRCTEGRRHRSPLVHTPHGHNGQS